MSICESCLNMDEPCAKRNSDRMRLQRHRPAPGRVGSASADPASTSSEAGDVLPIPGNADSGLNGKGSSNIDVD